MTLTKATPQFKNSIRASKGFVETAQGLVLRRSAHAATQQYHTRNLLFVLWS